MSKLNKFLVTAITGVAMLSASGAYAETIRVGLVAKVLGNGFFEAANRGAQEAAAELGDLEIIYTGPTDTTAVGQINVINALIAQRVDAIAISANDTDALVPALKRAMKRGIKVVSWDSGVAVDGRDVHLNPSSNDLIGWMNVKLASDAMKDGKGKFAILSATTTSTNQNIWIEEMKKVLPQYPGMELLTIAYGDDLAEKSYREAKGLIRSYKDLNVIVSPSSVGIVAAAQAVADEGKIGEIFVTGLGLPSEMAGHVKSGASQSFAIWNPIDLGYSTAYIAYNLVKGTAKAEPGAEISIGRVGKIKLDGTRAAGMSDPFIYDASNVEEFAKIF
ncbi:rhamnose ABC transporter substrate-binding protein [Pseudovibrio sp. Tun.PSC04-5.I4]|uniref:rhamnose ABC transporter substrate-binding protein n=1 Tax=Pseudovibrio sp. Tun.PSC04-5.I4 TaxID=1798213 RepID=UPI00088C4CE6|nr:rhamnose ABC transporter substrate-binding protein [Pseudovibrio sp. Tun.PSC04-5.I4]SDQ13126.1 rhamnose-binding protein [Pseudovibrio sp. Tun.PSC04-5.I4]